MRAGASAISKVALPPFPLPAAAAAAAISEIIEVDQFNDGGLAAASDGGGRGGGA